MGERIESWAQLRRAAPQILSQLNADDRLALAAAANPLLAIERLDYVISPAVRDGIADRLRLGPEAASRLAALEIEISEHAGHEVNPGDPEQVRRLIEDLGAGAAGDAAGAGVDVTLPRWRPGAPVRDPLEELRDRHDVMEPLLEYRRIVAQAPPFAPPEVFMAVLEGRLTPRVSDVTGRFQRGADDDS